MNASALKFDSSLEKHVGPRFGGNWRVLGQYATIEAAKEAAARLAGKIEQTRLTMVDGVTLLGRV